MSDGGGGQSVAFAKPTRGNVCLEVQVGRGHRFALSRDRREGGGAGVVRFQFEVGDGTGRDQVTVNSSLLNKFK